MKNMKDLKNGLFASEHATLSFQNNPFWNVAENNQ